LEIVHPVTISVLPGQNLAYSALFKSIIHDNNRIANNYESREVYPMLWQDVQRPVYQDFELLGSGATGEVYKARRLSDGLMVAKKYSRFFDISALHDFQREAWNQQRVNSPFVVNIIGFDFRSQPPFLVLEYCDLGSAREALANVYFQPDKIAALLSHAAAGIEAIQSLGGVHRDIKPDNLLVKTDQNGNWVMKVNDFGIARLPQGIAGAFLTRTPAGTPGYAAPEILRGAPPTKASDIFSFGVTIHELFTNFRPAPGSKILACPGILRPMVQRMIDINPLNRPSISEVRKELILASEVLKCQRQGIMLLGGIVLVSVVVALISKEG
jgi:serine/threonine protein kinase